MLHHMLFGCPAHGTKGGVVKCAISVQEIYQSSKPIFESPLCLINKTGKDGMNGLTCLILHLLITYSPDRNKAGPNLTVGVWQGVYGAFMHSGCH
jgi:hypothetical protein